MSFSNLSKLPSRSVKVSFELFPPVNDQAEAGLFDTVKRLENLSPSSVSVTYGAGGSTRQRTISTIKKLKAETKLEVAAHLTCSDASREEVDGVVHELWAYGISRIVALRGDPAGGVGARYVPRQDGYANAAELVTGLKGFANFDITVAAYPEKHPESADFQTDLDMLKRKVDNGATRAITQFCFDNDQFESYLEKVRRAGIYIPIVPGILPIHDFRKVAGFAGKCGAGIPRWLAERFEGLENDPHTHALVAAVVAAEQVADLAGRGVSDFHFYTMNKAELPVAICRLLGVNEQNRDGAIAA